MLKVTVKTAEPALTWPVYVPGARFCETALMAMLVDCPGFRVPVVGVAVSHTASVVTAKGEGPVPEFARLVVMLCGVELPAFEESVTPGAAKAKLVVPWVTTIDTFTVCGMQPLT